MANVLECRTFSGHDDISEKRVVRVDITGSLKGPYLLATPKADGLARWMRTRFRTLSQHRLWSEQGR